MTSLLRILRSASSLWPLYVCILISAVTTAGLTLVSPFIIRQATDTIVAAVNGDTTTPDATRTILLLSGVLLAATLTQTLVSAIGGFYGDMMQARLRQALSNRYYAKLLSLPQRYFDNQVTGTIISRLDRSISTVTQFLQSCANNFLPMVLQVVATLVVTTLYYWPLTIFLVTLFPLYTWLTALTSKRWQKLEDKKNKQVDLAEGRFSEAVGQIKVVKSFVAEAREFTQFTDRHARTVDYTRPQSRWWHQMDAIRGSVLSIIFFGIYLVIFWRTLNGHFSLGDMVMLITLISQVQTPVRMMSWIVDTAQRAIAGSRDYFGVIEEKAENTANPEIIAAAEDPRIPTVSTAIPAALTPIDGEPVVELDNVTFEYEEGKPVLNNVSFAAERGQSVALVGESGGGKSTIVNLLLGLYTTNQGTLRMCGRDVRELSAAELRASVGVVFQEPFLFSGTIRENIAYGKPDATDAQIVEVARRANAHDFICAFPDGYDTVIGERGLRLSGGQKQRVSVARAMLKDAPILLLDEATSALDTKAERAVQAGLEELMAGRTTIVIAHRLSTIAEVDTIVTMIDGSVEEVGSPSDLATSGGVYSELLRLTASNSVADRRRLKSFGFRGDHDNVDAEEWDENQSED